MTQGPTARVELGCENLQRRGDLRVHSFLVFCNAQAVERRPSSNIFAESRDEWCLCIVSSLEGHA